MKRAIGRVIRCLAREWEKGRKKKKESHEITDTTFPFHRIQFRRHGRRKGWSSASLGVMRLAGSSARHLSSRSTNARSALSSSSFIRCWAADEGTSRLLRSRAKKDVIVLGIF